MHVFAKHCDPQPPLPPPSPHAARAPHLEPTAVITCCRAGQSSAWWLAESDKRHAVASDKGLPRAKSTAPIASSKSLVKWSSPKEDPPAAPAKSPLQVTLSQEASVASAARSSCSGSFAASCRRLRCPASHLACCLALPLGLACDFASAKERLPLCRGLSLSWLAFGSASLESQIVLQSFHQAASSADRPAWVVTSIIRLPKTGAMRNSLTSWLS